MIVVSRGLSRPGTPHGNTAATPTSHPCLRNGRRPDSARRPERRAERSPSRRFPRPEGRRPALAGLRGASRRPARDRARGSRTSGRESSPMPDRTGTARPPPNRTEPGSNPPMRRWTMQDRVALTRWGFTRYPHRPPALRATSPMLRIPVRARPAYRSSSYPGRRQRVRREPSRSLVGRIGDDARRRYWKWQQEVCAFPRQCRAAVEGSSGCGSRPCRPVLPGRRFGSRRTTPAPATRLDWNSSLATAAEIMPVLAVVPGEPLGAQRIEGTSLELPTSHGAAAAEPIASGDERTWQTRTPSWRHPTTPTPRSKS